MDAGLIMGPVLLFRGLRGETLHLCALSVTEDGQPGDLDVAGGGRFRAEPLLRLGGQTLWRHAFQLPAAAGAKCYRLAGRSHRVVPPPAARPRLLFTACNGSEAPGDLPERPQERLRPWRMIARAHARESFHLLIQGGDQIYADQVWHAHPRLAPLKADREAAAKAEFTSAMGDAVYAHYFQRYVESWAEPGIAEVMATVPSVMIWDDHDIIDGWGSWAPRLQASPVFQGIYAAARRAFAAFQLGLRPDEALPEGFLDPTGGHYGWLYRIGRTALYAPDLRSERTETAVMGPAGWRGLDSALQQAHACDDLFVVSSVPLLNTPLRVLERLHFAVPGHQFFQDDLRDQWQSYAHAEEWARFTSALLRYRRATGAHVTVLSGEIHLGAFGVLDAPDGPIIQLTSSGVTHPPPPWLVARLMGLAAMPRHRIADVAQFRMRPVPGFGVRYLDQRNWLVLAPAPGEGYVARWCTEGRGEGPPLPLHGG